MIQALQQWLPFLLFAFVAAITPGPTNLLIFSNSARHGWSAALPIVFGGCGGAALVVLAVGSGLGELLAGRPQVQGIMAAAGVLWLTWLAWQIWSSPPPGLEDAVPARRVGLLDAALLQLVNPKNWTVALAVIGVYAGQGDDRLLRIQLMSLLFFMVGVPCLSAWAGLGAGSARLLRSPRALQRLNRGLAVLLVLSAWAGVL
ncbi:LysE family translocator [Pseudomonas citronellolis]|uniref:LysE family translocator n=1 Tax=Pseudomonas citronellolis TaxID=53408 RepID=UPI000E2F69FC|nr:LysE family translocator [Pseudomonas citronellolis]MCP1603701.1 threonine/homoserine/homoserine lactone efflux protein [Pseudomonas citronellolis]MCP1653232.1 threonine/homoserine/homoserine lactone efflux protein [Pseudomonas citronellolis]MCP1720448.1 threonine/homoserine/homoserine lactone efflux protein [Pseudomonas citronellolis]UXJ54729.1 LysE family translocator [Pseudomonas citronellolis]WBG62675.1 LysE family translocator [Pseudomonas citronellolis]